MFNCVIHSQQFTASMTITNDPNMGAGALINVNPIYYDAVNLLMRLDYPNLKDLSGKQGFVEIYNFKNNTLVQLCNVCSTYSNLNTIPKFYKEANDIVPSVQSNIFPYNINNTVCNPFQKVNPQGGVLYLWITDKGIPCRAVQTDGTTYDFQNVVIGAPNPSVFQIPPNSNCPSIPKCASPIDLVLVLDESGSIDRTEWSDMIEFAINVVNSFTIGLNNTQVGLVFFSGYTYGPGQDPASCCGFSDPALRLSFDESTILKFLYNHNQTGGHTCINCGIKTATTYEPNINRPVQVPKLMLVLTDGYNNRMTDFFSIDIQNAKNAGWNIFAIGVKNASLYELQQIASSPDQLFFINDFSALKVISNSVNQKLCGAYPNLTPCGPLCQGICACGGQCICPDKCVSSDKCSQGSCVTGVSGSQCLFTQTFCDPSKTNGNLCLQNVCNKTTGNCVLINKNCSSLAPDSCFTNSCNPASGCLLIDNCPAIQTQPGTNNPSLCLQRVCNNGACAQTARNCTNPNACAVPSCDPTLGCVSTVLNCDDGNRCTNKTCDPYLGCQYKPISCPSSDFFTSQQYKSNPAAYNCLQFKCDPTVGCTSYNKTCDDGNICTADSCNATNGNCINTPITCPTSNNKCIIPSCDYRVGCLNTTKNCDDNNFCTNDSCDPTTGNCINIPLICTIPSDKCYNSVCSNSSRGCILIPIKLCPQSTTDKCIKNTCNPNSGNCEQLPYLCVPPNLCSTTICNSTLGCINVPKICNDNNSCTIDTCDLTSGQCVFTPIAGCNNQTCSNCATLNPCLPKKCENANCVTVQVSCPSTKCSTITPTAINGQCACLPSNPVTCPKSTSICDLVCNPLTGNCSTVGSRVCDDDNVCTIDQCIVVNGIPTCNYTAITCPGDSACSRKKCINQNGAPLCIDDTSNSVNCSASANQCSVGTCNTATGQCQYTSQPCSNPSNTTCLRNICNPVLGQCEANVPMTCPATDPIGCGSNGVCAFLNNQQQCKYNAVCNQTDNGCLIVSCNSNSNGSVCQTTTFNCNDNNPCTIDQCVANGVDYLGRPKSTCQYTPFACPPSADPCSLNLCVNQNGKPVCQSTPVVCNITSNCTLGKCSNVAGKGVCSYSEISCGTSDNCTIYSCDPQRGCIKSLKCNDGNPCTDDFCNAKTGNCTFSQKVCNSTNLCQVGVCDPNVGCVLQPVNCANISGNGTLDACHFATCVNSTGCQIAVVPNSLDACGLCNKPGKCHPRKSAIPAGAVAGAVIGGAVIAGVAALAIGLYAASSASEIFVTGSEGSIVGGNNNPLYAETDNAGTNPFENLDDGNHDYVPL